jgi:hypothetical protein
MIYNNINNTYNKNSNKLLSGTEKFALPIHKPFFVLRLDIIKCKRLVTMITIKHLLTVVTIPMLFLRRKEWGHKLAWPRTNAPNSKINYFPRAVCPRWISFVFGNSYCDPPFGRNNGIDGLWRFSKIQFNSYLFACQLNSPRANYKVSMSERKEINIHKVQNKAK